MTVLYPNHAQPRFHHAVMAGAAAVLVHTPSFVRYGSKPVRELISHPDLLPQLLNHLRKFSEAVAYPPTQAFIGTLHPRMMGERPWTTRPVASAHRFAPFGEMMPEGEFLGLLVLADEFQLLRLTA